MTIDEAINTIKSECYVFNLLNLDKSTMINTALDMAIQAMEQEPCEDCVSREEVLKQMKEWRDCEFVKMTNPYHYLEKRIQSMSPVTPTFLEEATNGDMIKAMFPNAKIKNQNEMMIVVDVEDNGLPHSFWKDWWNAPYQRGGEE